MSSVIDVRRIVANALGLDLDEVGDDASMDSLAAWDSLQHLGVITAIESAFTCRLTPDEITRLTSVQQIAAHLESRQKAS